MVSIFEYTDYRHFLLAYYKGRKAGSRSFSYRFIAKKVGMDRSYVIRVLHGALHITTEKSDAFIALCKLMNEEADYFRNLVLYCRAKTESEKKIHHEKLLSITRVFLKKIEQYQYELYKATHYLTIWSLLHFYQFRGDYTELASFLIPPITVDEARYAIKLLRKLGLLEKKNNKEYVVKDLNITSGRTWKSPEIIFYQKEMIQRASEALERFNKEQRNISTLTMNFSEEVLPEIDAVTSRYRETLVKLVNSKKNSEQDKVYQINIQIFPLTKSLGSLKE